MDVQALMPFLSDGAKPYAQRIAEVYSAPFARELGIEIDSLDTESSVLHLDIVPKHINSRGFVHGAVIYALMDHSLAFISNMRCESVGQSSNVVYHRPVKEGRLVCRTGVVNTSRNFTVLESKVYGGEKLIASSTLTAYKVGDI